MSQKTILPSIGITSGDEAGIGPEIIVKTLARKNIPRARFVIYGSARTIDKVAADLKIKLPYCLAHSISDIDPKRKINLINCPQKEPAKIAYGKSTVQTARNAFQYITLAAHDALAGKIDAIVTAPISKIAMQKAGINIHGHTDYLARLSRIGNYAMMFVGGGLKVVLATIHIPLKKVPSGVTRENLHDKILLTNTTLKNMFRIKKPRIAVCGLNPHAGEEGMLGSEEREIIIPLLKQLRRRGVDVVGPFPADTVFNRALNREFDVVIAMYHDQGLIPIKLLAFDSGVNMTLGLPFIRTSPDHGTAFDIAGRGIASPNSFAAALKLAITLSRNT